MRTEAHHHNLRIISIKNYLLRYENQHSLPTHSECKDSKLFSFNCLNIFFNSIF